MPCVPLTNTIWRSHWSTRENAVPRRLRSQWRPTNAASRVGCIGLGLSSLIGEGYSGINPPVTPSLNIPGISDMPVLGPILFSHDALVYLSVALVIGTWAAWAIGDRT